METEHLQFFGVISSKVYTYTAKSLCNVRQTQNLINVFNNWNVYGLPFSHLKHTKNIIINIHTHKNTSRLARAPTYIITFMSGSHFLNSFAQFDKVDNGTTTRNGPWICWAFCRKKKKKRRNPYNAFITTKKVKAVPNSSPTSL